MNSLKFHQSGDDDDDDDESLLPGIDPYNGDGRRQGKWQLALCLGFHPQGGPRDERCRRKCFEAELQRSRIRWPLVAKMCQLVGELTPISS